MAEDLEQLGRRWEQERLERDIAYLQKECSRLNKFHEQLRSAIYRIYRQEVPPQFQNAAARTKGVNRTELAKLYGIDRTTLYRRLQPIIHLLPTDRQRFTLEELALIYLELGIPSGLDAKE